MPDGPAQLKGDTGVPDVGQEEEKTAEECADQREEDNHPLEMLRRGRDRLACDGAGLQFVGAFDGVERIADLPPGILETDRWGDGHGVSVETDAGIGSDIEHRCLYGFPGSWLQGVGIDDDKGIPLFEKQYRADQLREDGGVPVDRDAVDAGNDGHARGAGQRGFWKAGGAIEFSVAHVTDVSEERPLIEDPAKVLQVLLRTERQRGAIDARQRELAGLNSLLKRDFRAPSLGCEVGLGVKASVFRAEKVSRDRTGGRSDEHERRGRGQKGGSQSSDRKEP